jgi:hypothetical protein
MAENIDAERERAAFEAWVASKGDADIAWLERDKRHGFYINLTVSKWWEAWQAARRTPSASIGEDAWIAANRAPYESIGEANSVEFDGIGEGRLQQAAQGVQTELLQEIQIALDLLADTKMTTSTYVNVTNVLHHCHDAITGRGYYGAALRLSSEALTDEQIIEAMYPYMLEADGGYSCDLAQKHVVAGVRAVLRLSSEQQAEKGKKP